MVRDRGEYVFESKMNSICSCNRTFIYVKSTIHMNDKGSLDILFVNKK